VQTYEIGIIIWRTCLAVVKGFIMPFSNEQETIMGRTVGLGEASTLSDEVVTRTTGDIQAWMVTYLAELLEISEEDIDASVPFDRYGLDSSAAVGMTGELEDWLGVEIDPTVIYDYPTIDALSHYLGST
jgi:acyl carrier protein